MHTFKMLEMYFLKSFYKYCFIYFTPHLKYFCLDVEILADIYCCFYV